MGLRRKVSPGRYLGPHGWFLPRRTVHSSGWEGPDAAQAGEQLQARGRVPGARSPQDRAALPPGQLLRRTQL